MVNTPEQSLDLMVRYLLEHEIVSFMDEVQNYWREDWDIFIIKKPDDSDELSLCLKASIVERMVQVWSSPPKNRHEQVPKWCEEVSEYVPGWSVVPESELHFFEGSPASEVFKKRNIFAPQDFIFFV